MVYDRFPGLDLYYADPAQPLTAASEELDDLDDDISVDDLDHVLYEVWTSSPVRLLYVLTERDYYVDGRPLENRQKCGATSFNAYFFRVCVVKTDWASRRVRYQRRHLVPELPRSQTHRAGELAGATKKWRKFDVHSEA